MKQHYLVLDGLRGVAALSVGILHYANVAGYGGNFAKANLAVDFFFVLSGFVLSYAYSDRLLSGKLSTGSFVSARIIRLCPLIALSMVLSFILRLPSIMSTSLPIEGLSEISSDLVLGVLLIPQVVQLYGGNPNIFPLNSPAWSIFFEVFINIAWAVVMIRMPRRALYGSAILALTALSFYVFRRGELSAGIRGGVNFLFGFPRVYFSFAIGLIIHRVHVLNSVPQAGFLTLTASLLIITLIPGEDAGPIYDLIAIAVIIPAIVLIGAASHSTGNAKLLSWFGEMSFPFYAVHNVLLWSWTEFSRKALFAEPSIVSLIALFLFSVFVSVPISRLIDQPLRARIGRVLLGNRPMRP